jgi:Family of unknown function (DUF6152)
MERRLVVCALAVAPFAVRAHHGWSSFDTARPIYLEGRAVNVAWRNPHAELDLDVAPDLKLPADLAQRKVPAQSASVDGAGVLKAAQVPTRKDKRWHIELAPLTRMDAWKVAEIKNGDRVAMVGYTFTGEKGEPLLRVEYLWSGDKVVALRSSPA